MYSLFVNTAEITQIQAENKIKIRQCSQMQNLKVAYFFGHQGLKEPNFDQVTFSQEKEKEKKQKKVFSGLLGRANLDVR